MEEYQSLALNTDFSTEVPSPDLKVVLFGPYLNIYHIIHKMSSKEVTSLWNGSVYWDCLRLLATDLCMYVKHLAEQDLTKTSLISHIKYNDNLIFLVNWFKEAQLVPNKLFWLQRVANKSWGNQHRQALACTLSTRWRWWDQIFPKYFRYWVFKAVNHSVRHYFSSSTLKHRRAYFLSFYFLVSYFVKCFHLYPRLSTFQWFQNLHNSPLSWAPY